MISLVNTVEIPFAAERVWESFRRMDEHYQDWIPEHLVWRWLRGEPLDEGTIWHADEWVGSMRINTRFEVIAAQSGRAFSYRILGFPANLVRTGGSLELTPRGNDRCELRQEAHFGFDLPLLGAAIDSVMRLVLPIEEFRRHIRQEGDALPALIARMTLPSAGGEGA